MRDTQVALFVHLVWGTWDRLPLLMGELERRVYRCIEDTCREMGVEVLALGGVEDHVHLVVRFPATLAIADLVKRIKGASSHLATHDIAPDEFFKWQGGYGAFSANADGLPALCAYVRGQKAHHRLGTLVAALEPDLT
ncbi:MAG TPA: IS200/IS605 family transposase [Ktedonobacterales bacterium]|jgi:REP element-mobilizing transposase RayT|nr:IS200/IS605 family transposase [Ktedonobacterales bacterium]